MRKVRLLVMAVLGVWVGWRARDSYASIANFKGVGRRGSARSASGDLSPAEAVEKLRAVVVLGRERGIDLLNQLRAGRHAA